MAYEPLRSRNGQLGLNAYPTVTTQAVDTITSSSVNGNGTLVNAGGSGITVRGFVYSTSTLNPTLADSVQNASGTGTGAFTAAITSLSSSTTYYYRAYATNAIGTGYGDMVSFTTSAGAGATYAPMRSMMGMGF